MGAIADIIFFAVITLILIIKIKEQLGKIDDDENNTKKRENIRKYIIENVNPVGKSNTENIVVSDEIAVVDSTEFGDNDKKILQNISTEYANNLRLIKRNFPWFSIESFIKSGVMAFEMLMDGFCRNDDELLKFLLTENLYNNFKNSIKDRNGAGNEMIFSLVGVSDKRIKICVVDENIVSLTIWILSEQISYIKSLSDGEVISGSDKTVNLVENELIFVKSLSSTDRNWKISSIR